MIPDIEEMLSIVFNKPEWRMADFPYGDNKEAVLDAMSEYGKLLSIGFGKWLHSPDCDTWMLTNANNDIQYDKLFDQYLIYLQSLNKQP